MSINIAYGACWKNGMRETPHSHKSPPFRDRWSDLPSRLALPPPPHPFNTTHTHTLKLLIRWRTDFVPTEFGTHILEGTRVAFVWKLSERSFAEYKELWVSCWFSASVSLWNRSASCHQTYYPRNCLYQKSEWVLTVQQVKYFCSFVNEYLANN